MWEGWVWRVSVGGVGMKGENVGRMGVKGGGGGWGGPSV